MAVQPKNKKTFFHLFNRMDACFCCAGSMSCSECSLHRGFRIFHYSSYACMYNAWKCKSRKQPTMEYILPGESFQFQRSQYFQGGEKLACCIQNNFKTQLNPKSGIPEKVLLFLFYRKYFSCNGNMYWWVRFFLFVNQRFRLLFEVIRIYF